MLFHRTDYLHKSDLRKIIQIIEKTIKEGKEKVVHEMFKFCKNDEIIEYFRDNSSEMKLLQSELVCASKLNWSRDVRKECSTLAEVFKVEFMS